MKFLTKETKIVDNYFSENPTTETTYVFKKGKFNRTNVEDVKDLDYFKWILSSVSDLAEEERLVFEKRVLELQDEEEAAALDKDIEVEQANIAKLKEEVEALKVQNSSLEDKKAKLKALKEEVEKLEEEKETEERKTAEMLKNVGINFNELEEAIDNILSLANRESFIRASTKEEISDELSKFEEAKEKLEELNLESKAINTVTYISINRLKDRDAAIIRNLTAKDFMKVEELQEY